MICETILKQIYSKVLGSLKSITLETHTLLLYVVIVIVCGLVYIKLVERSGAARAKSFFLDLKRDQIKNYAMKDLFGKKEYIFFLSSIIDLSSI